MAEDFPRQKFSAAATITRASFALLAILFRINCFSSNAAALTAFNCGKAQIWKQHLAPSPTFPSLTRPALTQKFRYFDAVNPINVTAPPKSYTAMKWCNLQVKDALINSVFVTSASAGVTKNQSIIEFPPARE